MAKGAEATVTDLPKRGRQMSLPNFEKFKVGRVRYDFGGSLEVALTTDEDIAMAAAASLHTPVEVVVRIGDHEMVLDGRINSRTHRFTKREDSDSLISVHKIIVNSVTDDDDGGEPAEGE